MGEMTRDQMIVVLQRHGLIDDFAARYFRDDPIAPLRPLEKATARRLAALETVVDFARHGEGCNAGVDPAYACKCGYSAALAALDREVGNG